jgi:hypothetical protein
VVILLFSQSGDACRILSLPLWLRRFRRSGSGGSALDGVGNLPQILSTQFETGGYDPAIHLLG